MNKIISSVFLGFLIFVTLQLLTGFGIFGTASAALVDTPAPDFTLTSLAGEEVSLTDYRGKVVLLTFWFPSCSVCRIELPRLETIWNENRIKGFDILAIEVTGDKIGAEKFMTKYGLGYTVLENRTVGSSTVDEQYKVDKYPTSFLIDKNGIVRHHYIGFLPGSEKTIEKDLLALIND